MHVDQLIARVRARIAMMQTTAEEYEIEARFHADKALDLRLGVMELNQLITSVSEFVDGELSETPADSRPGSEVAASDAAAALAGEVFPSASPAPHSAAPEPLVATTDTAKLAAEEAPSHASGEVQDRCGSTSPPISAEAPTDETGHASSSELKAPDPAPAGEGGASPAPTVQQRVKALHDAHPEYTAKQAREALGLTKGSLSGASFMLGVKWTHEAPRAEVRG